MKGNFQYLFYRRKNFIWFTGHFVEGERVSTDLVFLRSDEKPYACFKGTDDQFGHGT